MFWLSCQPIPFGFLGMCLVIHWPMLRTMQLAARATHGLFSCFITPWSRSWNRRWSCPRVAIHRSCRPSTDTGLGTGPRRTSVGQASCLDWLKGAAGRREPGVLRRLTELQQKPRRRLCLRSRSRFTPERAPWHGRGAIAHLPRRHPGQASGVSGPAPGTYSCNRESPTRSTWPVRR